MLVGRACAVSVCQWLVLLGCILGLGRTQGVMSLEYRWTGASGQPWFDLTSNWDPPGLPADRDVAVFDEQDDGAGHVAVRGSHFIGDMQFVNPNATLILSPGGSLTVLASTPEPACGYIVLDGGQLTMRGTRECQRLEGKRGFLSVENLKLAGCGIETTSLLVLQGNFEFGGHTVLAPRQGNLRLEGQHSRFTFQGAVEFWGGTIEVLDATLDFVGFSSFHAQPTMGAPAIFVGDGRDASNITIQAHAIRVSPHHANYSIHDRGQLVDMRADLTFRGIGSLTVDGDVQLDAGSSLLFDDMEGVFLQSSRFSMLGDSVIATSCQVVSGPDFSIVHATAAAKSNYITLLHGAVWRWSPMTSQLPVMFSLNINSGAEYHASATATWDSVNVNGGTAFLVDALLTSLLNLDRGGSVRSACAGQQCFPTMVTAHTLYLRNGSFHDLDFQEGAAEIIPADTSRPIDLVGCFCNFDSLAWATGSGQINLISTHLTPSTVLISSDEPMSLTSARSEDAVMIISAPEGQNNTQFKPRSELKIGFAHLILDGMYFEADNINITLQHASLILEHSTAEMWDLEVSGEASRIIFRAGESSPNWVRFSLSSDSEISLEEGHLMTSHGGIRSACPIHMDQSELYFPESAGEGEGFAVHLWRNATLAFNGVLILSHVTFEVPDGNSSISASRGFGLTIAKEGTLVPGNQIAVGYLDVLGFVRCHGSQSQMPVLVLNSSVTVQGYLAVSNVDILIGEGLQVDGHLVFWGHSSLGFVDSSPDTWVFVGSNGSMVVSEGASVDMSGQVTLLGRLLLLGSLNLASGSLSLEPMSTTIVGDRSCDTWISLLQAGEQSSLQFLQYPDGSVGCFAGQQLQFLPATLALTTFPDVPPVIGEWQAIKQEGPFGDPIPVQVLCSDSQEAWDVFLEPFTTGLRLSIAASQQASMSPEPWCFDFGCHWLPDIDNSELSFGLNQSDACPSQMPLGLSATCQVGCREGLEPDDAGLQLTATCSVGIGGLGFSTIEISPAAGCTPRRCDRHPLLTAELSGYTEGNCGDGLAHGARCSLGCEPDYQQQGSLSVSCTKGHWTMPEGQCVPVGCRLPVPVPNDLFQQGSCVSDDHNDVVWESVTATHGSSCKILCDLRFVEEPIELFNVECQLGDWPVIPQSACPRSASTPSPPPTPGIVLPTPAPTPMVVEARIALRFRNILDNPLYPHLSRLGQRDGTGRWNDVTRGFQDDFVQLTLDSLSLFEQVLVQFTYERQDSQALVMQFQIINPRNDPRTPKQIAEQIREMIWNPNSRWWQSKSYITELIDLGFFEWSLFDFTLDILAELALWQIILVVVLFVLLGLALWLLLKRYWPDANNLVVIGIMGSLLDLFTDIIFIMSLNSMDDYRLEFALAIVFVILPLLTNAALVIWILTGEAKDNFAFVKWESKFPLLSSACMALSSLNTSHYRLADSGLFDSDSLVAPLTKVTQKHLAFFAIASILLEDIPQLFLQISVIRQEGSFESAAALSMLVTMLVILFTLGMRMWFHFCPSQTTRKSPVPADTKTSSEPPLETNAEEIELVAQTPVGIIDDSSEGAVTGPSSPELELDLSVETQTDSVHLVDPGVGLDDDDFSSADPSILDDRKRLTFL